MNTTRAIVLSLVLATGAIAPAAAIAKHGADDDPARADDRGGQRGDDRGNAGKAKRTRTIVRVAGECTGNASAKLKVKRDRGRLKTELEVDQNIDGVAWDVELRRNGTVVVDTTRAPSGSFSIERRLTNGAGAGADTVRATATSPTGEVCTASATI